MAGSLLEIFQTYLTTEVIQQTSAFLHESPAQTEKAIQAAVPALLAAFDARGSTSSGAESVMSLVAEIGSKLDVPALLDPRGNTPPPFTDLATLGHALLAALFGTNAASIADNLATISGVRPAAASTLLSVLMPIVLGVLEREVATERLNAAGLAALLASQRDDIKYFVPASIATLLAASSIAAPPKPPPQQQEAPPPQAPPRQAAPQQAAPHPAQPPQPQAAQPPTPPVVQPPKPQASQPAQQPAPSSRPSAPQAPAQPGAQSTKPQAAQPPTPAVVQAPKQQVAQPQGSQQPQQRQSKKRKKQKGSQRQTQPAPPQASRQQKQGAPQPQSQSTSQARPQQSPSANTRPTPPPSAQQQGSRPRQDSVTPAARSTPAPSQRRVAWLVPAAVIAALALVGWYAFRTQSLEERRAAAFDPTSSAVPANTPAPAPAPESPPASAPTSGGAPVSGSAATAPAPSSSSPAPSASSSSSPSGSGATPAAAPVRNQLKLEPGSASEALDAFLAGGGSTGDLPKTFTFDRIVFQSASTRLMNRSRHTVSELVEVLKAHPNVEARIEAHTDNMGDPQQNKALSEKRAEAIKKMLVSGGIAESRLKTEGVGEEKPIASNDTVEGRRRNRRLDVVVVKR